MNMSRVSLYGAIETSDPIAYEQALKAYGVAVERPMTSTAYEMTGTGTMAESKPFPAHPRIKARQ